MTDTTLTYPLDPQPCIVCGEPAIAWPEGPHHVEETLDNDHEPIIEAWEIGGTANAGPAA